VIDVPGYSWDYLGQVIGTSHIKVLQHCELIHTCSYKNRCLHACVQP